MLVKMGWLITCLVVVSLTSTGICQKTPAAICYDPQPFERSHAVEIDQHGKMKLTTYTPSMGIGIREFKGSDDLILPVLSKEYKAWLNESKIPVHSIPPTQIRPDANVTQGTLAPVIKQLQEVTSNHLVIRFRIGPECKFVSVLIPEYLTQGQIDRRKPLPLALYIESDSDGRIRLNNEDVGTLSDFTKLKNRLRGIFDARRKSSVFREGTEKIEAATYFLPHSSTSFGNISEVFKAIAGSGGDPLYLVIDEKNTFPPIRVLTPNQ